VYPGINLLTSRRNIPKRRYVLSDKTTLLPTRENPLVFTLWSYGIYQTAIWCVFNNVSEKYPASIVKLLYIPSRNIVNNLPEFTVS